LQVPSLPSLAGRVYPSYKVSVSSFSRPPAAAAGDGPLWSAGRSRSMFIFFVGKKIFIYLGISLPKVADLLVDLVE
jgi:hypothetical protein